MLFCVIGSEQVGSRKSRKSKKSPIMIKRMAIVPPTRKFLPVAKKDNNRNQETTVGNTSTYQNTENSNKLNATEDRTELSGSTKCSEATDGYRNNTEGNITKLSQVYFTPLYFDEVIYPRLKKLLFYL